MILYEVENFAKQINIFDTAACSFQASVYNNHETKNNKNELDILYCFRDSSFIVSFIYLPLLGSGGGCRLPEIPGEGSVPCLLTHLH